MYYLPFQNHIQIQMHSVDFMYPYTFHKVVSYYNLQYVVRVQFIVCIFQFYGYRFMCT